MKKKMTLEQFLTALEATPRTWWLYGTHQKIANAENHCPMHAVYGWDYNRFLKKRLEIAIAKAADNPDRTPLRIALLRACGLES